MGATTTTAAAVSGTTTETVGEGDTVHTECEATLGFESRSWVGYLDIVYEACSVS